jgi:hypothetical protein
MPEHDQIGNAVGRIAAVAGSTPLLFGSWHGDFAPWNIAGRADTLLVWDWERFTTGVPVGFDALHYDIQPRILRPGTPPDTVIAERLTDAPRLLTPLGVEPVQVPLVAVLYLLEITTRYLLDGQKEAGIWAGLMPGLVRALGAAADSLPAEPGSAAGSDSGGPP